MNEPPDFYKTLEYGVREGALNPGDGMFWSGLLLNFFCHFPVGLTTFVYLRKRCGFESVLMCAYTLVSMVYLGSLLLIKSEVLSFSDAPAIYEIISNQPELRKYHTKVEEVRTQKMLGLECLQWRAMMMYLTAVNFAMLFLVVLQHKKRSQDRLVHGMLVFGCLFLFTEHTQLRTEANLGVRLFPVLLFGLFVIIKKKFFADYQTEYAIIYRIERLGKFSIPVTTLVWIFAILFSLLSMTAEDQNTSLAMPLHHFWLFFQGLAFACTVCLFCSSKRPLSGRAARMVGADFTPPPAEFNPRPPAEVPPPPVPVEPVEMGIGPTENAGDRPAGSSSLMGITESGTLARFSSSRRPQRSTSGTSETNLGNSRRPQRANSGNQGGPTGASSENLGGPAVGSQASAATASSRMSSGAR